MSLAIARQLKGYCSDDPAVKHEKCLPIGVFRKMWNNRATALAAAIGQLAVGALFFGMRSCEYTDTAGDRKTRLLRVMDIKFLRGRREIKKEANQFYSRADSVTICFTHQKNGEKEAEITMHKSIHGLCPVQAWGQIVSRILSYPKSSPESPVNLVEKRLKNRMNYVKVKSSQVLQHIRNTVTQIGFNKLGFGPKEVGTHSIRSSFAMFLHLNDVKTEKIMLQGRWKSTAFLSYIRVQVLEFSAGLSGLMNNTRDFYTVPETNFDHRELHHLHVPHRYNPFEDILTRNPGLLAF